MTQRAMKQVLPFDFRSDFGPQIIPAPEPASPETQGGMSISPAELADLLSQARMEGIEEGMLRLRREEDDRLQAVTQKLNQALANLVALAGHLESSAYDQDMTETSLRLINATARRIIDGQGDLFADRKESSGDTVPRRMA
jgi:hypothetical protein